MADKKRGGGEAISLVSDTLQKSGKLEKVELMTCIEQLSKKAEEVKSQVYATIYQKHTEFLLANNNTYDLYQKVLELSSNMQAVNQTIETQVQPQLSNATKEHRKLKRELETSSAVIILLEQLLKVDENFSIVMTDITYKRYFEAAHVLGQVKTQLEGFSQDIEGNVFKPLWCEYTKQKTNLTKHLEKAWSEGVKWTPSGVPSVNSLEGQLETSLKIGHAALKDFRNIVGAMQAMGILEKRLKIFGKKLVQYLLRPLVLFPSLQITKDIKIMSAVLSFSKDSNRSKKVQPGILYEKLLHVIEFVQSGLFAREDDSASENMEKIDFEELFASLGKLVWPVLSDNILIKDYLAHTIPSTSSDLEKYKEVIQETLVFEHQLVSIGFISEDSMKLTNFAKDINVHFANKKCQDLLAAARDLMKGEIHNMILVSPDNDKAIRYVQEQSSDNLIAILNKDKESSGEDNKSSKSQIQKLLSEMTFRLPQCRISESVQKLVDMAYEIMREATTSSPECAIQLFYTVRNIFEMFYHVVPTFHQNSLVTLPQLAALHHNNCMYIAHHLQTLGVQFRPSLPPPLNQCATVSFIDLIPTLRTMGENCFLEQMKRQRDQLLEIIRSVGGFTMNDGEDEKVEEIVRAIKQVVHQLVHLSKVWYDVLPVDIYIKNLGALANVVLEEFIARVLELEDISAVESPQLNSLLSMLAEKLPEVFQRGEQEAKDISTTVKSWNRFKELIGILDSSLQNIIDRWEDGKGPLAHLLTAMEVRNLIRALFQNSDIRANALRKIKA